MLNRILILQHKGGEYIAINISGIRNERSTLWETLERAGKIMKMPSTTCNIALQILDSKITKGEIHRLTAWLKDMDSEINRIAIIGAGFFEKISISKSIKNIDLRVNSKFINNWETAKDWLVGYQI